MQYVADAVQREQTVTTIDLIFVTIAVHYGFGNHMQVIEEAGALSNFLFYTWMENFWFNVIISVGKLSAVSLLLALHSGIREWNNHKIFSCKSC